MSKSADRKDSIFTPGPWNLTDELEHGCCFEKHIQASGGHGDNPVAEVVRTSDAYLIALAPDMAALINGMRCLYKAPEVADEMCGHCTVCKVTKLIQSQTTNKDGGR